MVDVVYTGSPASASTLLNGSTATAQQIGGHFPEVGGPGSRPDAPECCQGVMRARYCMEMLVLVEGAQLWVARRLPDVLQSDLVLAQVNAILVLGLPTSQSMIF